MYVVYGLKTNESHGAFSSLGKIEKWFSMLKESPKETLFYFEYQIDKFESVNLAEANAEAAGWDWIYISSGENESELGSGGGWVPPKEVWGKCLLDKEIDAGKLYQEWIDKEYERRVSI